MNLSLDSRSRCVGVDFGTTNSALALADARAPEDATLVLHETPSGNRSGTFRSVLFFEHPALGSGKRPPAVAGPAAIERYLSTGGNGRLLQSLKSFLASPLMTATSIDGQRMTLEELIAALLRNLRESAERSVGALPTRAVFGRPVRFVNAEPEQPEGFPLERLRAAAKIAGFDEVTFEYEPVAAALHYERGLARDELVLIADFGGGTSDFTLVRVGPEARRRRANASAGGDEAIARGVLGTEGVGLAGDAFDARFVSEVVAPRLGKGGHYRSYFDKKRIPIPPWIYEHLARWHHLSFLKSRETMNFLREVRAQAEDPEQLEALLHVVEADLGYPLYRSVERCKFELTDALRAPFVFDDPPAVLERDVARDEFDRWIARDLEAITACLDRLFERTGVARAAVDRVFMTGGTSLVPAVRRAFASRFGEEKLVSGDEFTSIASGLALRAAELARA